MGNYVYNTIICKKDLLGKVLDENNRVDFGILIPEPATKQECLAEYGEQYISEEWVREIYEEAQTSKPWFNGVKWGLKFWGTKWNADDCDSVSEADGYIMVDFITTNSPPTVWIEKLAKLGKPFIFHWTEENGFGAMSSYHGKIDISMEFDSPEYDEDGDPIANEIDRELPSEERIKEFFGDL